MNKTNTTQQCKLHKDSPYGKKKIYSLILTGALLFTACPKALAQTVDSQSSYKMACVMQEEYSSSVASKIIPTATPSDEPKICTEFDWVDVDFKDITAAIAIVDGEEKVFFVETHFDDEDNMTLMEAFSFNTVFIEKYDGKLKFIPVGIMEGKKIEAIKEDGLELYLKSIGMSEYDAMIEISKIRRLEDLRKLYEKRVPKEKQVILPLFIPEDDYTKNENEQKIITDEELLWFFDTEYIMPDYLHLVRVYPLLVNGEKTVLYCDVSRDKNNDRLYNDVESYETLISSKSKDNFNKLYESKYIQGDIKYVDEEKPFLPFLDNFKQQTGKDLDESTVDSVGDFAKIKRLLDKGDTFYVELPIEQQEFIKQLIKDGLVNPASPDYSIDDYTTTSKVKTR